MSLLLHKKQPVLLERDSVVLGDFVAYSIQYCTRFSVIFQIKGDDARIYVKENLDVGNVYQFSLGVPRNFSSYFVHDLFVFNSFALLSWKFVQFASLPWNAHFRTKQIHSFEFEIFVFSFCAESCCISSEISMGENSADESLKIKTKLLPAVVCGLISTHCLVI